MDRDYKITDRQFTEWNVLLYGRIIDTVWFDSDLGALDVRRSLIDHDGYDSRITVRKEES